ncbi:hypothetical protein PFISCL1PPCAC_13643, partial [Pristionchus fissidentatus]
FDAFPFDKQNCFMCFALAGFAGSTVNLIESSFNATHFEGNAEWDVEGEIRMGGNVSDVDGMRTSTVMFHFSLARKSFFWVMLVIVPCCLLCFVALISIFFGDPDRIVENAANVGLNTMTSLMLVVTILADSLAKANTLPGLGWFVLIDIAIVCLAVVVLLVVDNIRRSAIEFTRRYPTKSSPWFESLLSKKAYRIVRIILFLVAIVVLVL